MLQYYLSQLICFETLVSRQPVHVIKARAFLEMS